MLKKSNFKLPPEFFVKVLRDYNDWKQAWIREVLQNSIDAGSKKIEITTSFENDIFTIKVKDNGKGMSLDVLENGFMALGGSSKDNDQEDNTGGFGVASMMIAQSHIDYTIRSSDYICKGSKGTYTVESASDVEGCEITVRMDKKSFSSFVNPTEIMRLKIGQWSNYSSVDNLEITYNGEDYSPSIPKFDYSFDTEIGTMNFSERNLDDAFSTSFIYIRVNKQPMFSVSAYHDGSSVPFYGVLDLNGSSLEMLTSNRDGLSDGKNRIISNILQELSKERTKYTLNNLEDFVLNEETIKQFQELEYASNDFENNSNDLADSSNTKKEANNNIKYEENEDSITKGIFQKKKSEFEESKRKVVSKLEKIKSNFYPKNFNIKYDHSDKNDPMSSFTNLVNELNKKRHQKIAWSTKILIEKTLDVLCKDKSYSYYKDSYGNYFYNDNPIKIGFVFKNRTEGLLSKNEEHNVIFVNPIIAYEFDLEELQDIVIHEIAHLEVSNHCEDFTINESYIRRASRKAFKISDIKKEIKEIHRNI